MRKIEEQMKAAVFNRKTWAGGNTQVVFIEEGLDASVVYLHGNHIATYNHDAGILQVNKDTLSRWPTVTTKSRLWALGANIATKNGITYLDGVAV